MWPSRSPSTSARRSRSAAAPGRRLGLGRQRQLHQDLEHVARPAARLRGHQQPLEQLVRLVRGRGCVSGAVLGQQHHRQGDVLELVQVGGLVIDRQVDGAGPGGRGGQVPFRELESCAQRGDGPHVRGEVPEVDLVGLVEELIACGSSP